MDNPYVSPSLEKDAEHPVDRNHPAGFGFVTRSVLLFVASGVLLSFIAMTVVWTYFRLTDQLIQNDFNYRAIKVAITGVCSSGTTVLGGILNNRRLSLLGALATILAAGLIIGLKVI